MPFPTQGQAIEGQASIGTKNDAATLDPTAVASVVSLLKGILKAAYDPANDMIKMSSMQQKFRESFPNAAVDATKWDVVTGSGHTVTVSGGVLTIATGTTINTETILTSKFYFTVPMFMQAALQLSQRIANQEFYIEFVSVDPTTKAVDNKNCAGWKFDGTTATYGKYYVQNNAAAVQLSADQTVTSTAGYSVFECEPFNNECWFHNTVLDSVNGRTMSQRKHRDIPDPNALYALRIRAKNLGTAPASTTNFQLLYVCCADHSELTCEITAGRGNTAAGQALAVTVVGTASVSSSATVTSAGSTYFAETLANQAAGATFTGASRDGSSTLSYNRFRVMVNHVAGNTPGHLVIEQSTDGTTWRETHRMPVPSDANYRVVEFPWLLRYVRAKFINGATAQTAFFLQETGVRLDGNFDFDKLLQFVETTTVLAAAGTYTGNALNLGANHSINRMRALAYADQAGTLYVDQSKDGTNWRQTHSAALAAAGVVTLEAPVFAQYVRVRYVNGATLQGAFELLSELVRD